MYLYIYIVIPVHDDDSYYKYWTPGAVDWELVYVVAGLNQCVGRIWFPTLRGRNEVQIQ